jgi:hypothetical protein
MNVELIWHQPLRLVDDLPQPFYSCPNFMDVPETPGIYVFARVRGRTCQPLYIGLATCLRSRISQHLVSIRLMDGIRQAPGGRRVILVGEATNLPARGGRTILASVERALIRHAVAEGWPILNKHGRVRVSYSINHSGNRAARAWG